MLAAGLGPFYSTATTCVEVGWGHSNLLDQAKGQPAPCLRHVSLVGSISDVTFTGEMLILSSQAAAMGPC